MAERTHFEYDGFSQIEGKLKAMALDDPQLKEHIRKCTWDVLAAVRKAVVENANFKDSRHNSIQAVRRSVYKKILGGSVSILDGKRRKGKSSNAGGRTQQINSYSGRDRGFILRFVNSGTEDRYAGAGRNKALSRSYIQSMRGKPGFRGNIKPMNFFAPAANGSIQKAAEKLAEMIDQEIAKQFNNG